METPSEHKPIRVFVVDDHPLLIEGISGIVEQQEDMIFCGGATTAAEGLRKVKSLRPDVCILDLHLQDGNGIELTREIRSQFPEVHVLVLSMCNDRVHAERALRAGASGYVEKAHATVELLDAIRESHAGKIHLSQDATTALLSRFVTAPADCALTPSVDSLSEREFQIFECLSKGMTNPEIAEQCCLSIRTVETYYSRIKEKLQLANTAQLRQFAIRWSKENCAA